MQNSSTSTLYLTESAARRIRAIIAGETKADAMVRLAVLGGGCSGFQYKFDVDSTFNAAEDIVIERDQARLVVDKTSLEYLKGSEVDFGESLMEAGFKINNPNAVSSCGCGTSFDVKDDPPS